MGFGILEDHKLPHVPGTVLLNEREAHSKALTHALKHGKGSNSDLILTPQPSEDPNDPLNWPQAEKDFHLAVLGLGATLFAASFGPLLAAGTVVISIDLGVTIPAVAQLGGYQLLVVGATGPFVCGCSRKFGKRPVFLFSGMMGIIGTIIGACANDYHMLLVARVVQGFATCAFESIVVTVIGDMYFVHERGIRISLLNFVLGAISNLVSVITGPITTNLGWQYCFYILIPFIGFQYILMWLFCPETSYKRDARYELDTNVNENFEQLAQLEKKYVSRVLPSATNSNDGNEQATRVQTSVSTRSIPPRKSFVKRLAPVTGIYSEDNLLRLFAAPFLCLANIAALWVIVMSGLIVAWYVGVSFIMAQWFSPPPYLYSAADVGYLSVGPAIGGFCAAIFMSVISDPIIKFSSNRNKGIYEPEFRLFPMVICLIFTVLGLTLYGYGLQQHWNPPLTAIVHGVVLFGILIGAISSSAYILDGYRDLSNEVFIMSMTFKNFFFYGMSYYVNNWIATGGPMQMFGIFAGISAFVILLGLPVYIWGKRYRSFWSRHNLMRLAGLKSHVEALGGH